MTTITFKEDINFLKTDYDTLLDFIEEIEDYSFWKIILQTQNFKTYDISLLKKKYLWK